MRTPARVCVHTIKVVCDSKISATYLKPRTPREDLTVLRGRVPSKPFVTGNLIS